MTSLSAQNIVKIINSEVTTSQLHYKKNQTHMYSHDVMLTFDIFFLAFYVYSIICYYLISFVHT